MDTNIIFERRYALSKNLKRIMTERQYTKAKLCAESGISRPTLDKLLDCKVTSLVQFEKHISKISECLNVEPKELVGITDTQLDVETYETQEMSNILIKMASAQNAHELNDLYHEAENELFSIYCKLFKQLVKISQPIKHGHWVEPNDDEEAIAVSCICSCCGWKSHIMEDDVYGMPYCPNCGARMLG